MVFTFEYAQPLVAKRLTIMKIIGNPSEPRFDLPIGASVFRELVGASARELKPDLTSMITLSFPRRQSNGRALVRHMQDDREVSGRCVGNVATSADRPGNLFGGPGQSSIVGK